MKVSALLIVVAYASTSFTKAPPPQLVHQRTGSNPQQTHMDDQLQNHDLLAAQHNPQPQNDGLLGVMMGIDGVEVQRLEGDKRLGGLYTGEHNKITHTGTAGQAEFNAKLNGVHTERSGVVQFDVAHPTTSPTHAPTSQWYNPDNYWVPCRVSEWSAFNPCSKSCVDASGPGNRVRRRRFIAAHMNPYYTAQDATEPDIIAEKPDCNLINPDNQQQSLLVDHDQTDTVSCNNGDQYNCPVDCTYADHWGAWQATVTPKGWVKRTRDIITQPSSQTSRMPAGKSCAEVGTVKYGCTSLNSDETKCNQEKPWSMTGRPADAHSVLAQYQQNNEDHAVCKPTIKEGKWGPCELMGTNSYKTRKRVETKCDQHAVTKILMTYKQTRKCVNGNEEDYARFAA